LRIKHPNRPAGYSLLIAAFESGATRQHPFEIVYIFRQMFRRRRGDETILARHETILGFARRYPETAVGYQSANDAADSAAHPETVKCGPSASS
jgi:hypothetical protein